MCDKIWQSFPAADGASNNLDFVAKKIGQSFPAPHDASNRDSVVKDNEMLQTESTKLYVQEA